MSHDRIAHFRIIEEIGRGGMGVVYLAEDEKLGRRVALKLMGERLQADPVARQRFVGEARAVAGLDHPFICSIFAAGEEDDGLAWMAMEYVQGETLRARLLSGPLPPAEALRVASEVAEALDCAHAGNIVHRDLKPENIMLTRSGRVKVMDFGLAKRVAPPAEPIENLTTATALTRQGTTVGTTRYMAPEQIRGRLITPRSDLFSLGVITYEMLTGRHPFPRELDLETAHAILHEAPVPLGTVIDRCPPELERLVNRLLAKEPEARYAEAREVREDLGRLLAAGTSSLSVMSVRSVTATGAGVPAASSGPAPDAATGGERASRRTRWSGPLLGAAAVLVGVLAVAFGVPAVRDALLGRSGAPAAAADAADLSPYELFTRAMALLDRYDVKGNVAEASRLLQIAVGKQADYAPAHAGLAEAKRREYWRKQDPDSLQQALRHARRAVELDPHLAIAHTVLGLILVETGASDEAEKELRLALDTDPSDARAQVGMGLLMESLHRPEKAEAAYRAALELDDKAWETHLHLGTLYYNQGRYKEAEAEFKRAAAVTPDNHVVYSNLAAACQMQGRYTEAAGYYQRSLEIEPGASTYSNLGTMQFFQGLYAQAASAYRSAVDLDAHNYLLWANLGDAYRFIPGDEKKALEAYSVATRELKEELRSHPDDPTLVSRLAVYQAKAGQSKDALSTLDTVEAMKSNNPGFLYRLVLAAEIAGARDRALASLELALKAGYPLAEVRRDPELVDLRADPGFQRLITRLAPDGAAGP